MENDITADTRISIFEACAALEIPEETLISLTGPGPFCAATDGLTVRLAYAASLSLMLPFDLPAAVAIALEAARGAEVGAGRTLMLMWPDVHQIVPHWLTSADRRPPTPVHLIPVDEMVGLFAMHLNAIRQGAIRPN